MKIITYGINFDKCNITIINKIHLYKIVLSLSALMTAKWLLMLF